MLTKFFRITFLLGFFVCGLFAFASLGQRPAQTPEEKPENKPTKSAPDIFPVKYEGGMFGYNEKSKGFLKFDNPNGRLVFFDKKNKEIFGIPYASIRVVYPHSNSVVSTTGRVIASTVPYFGVFGLFLREKRKYMIIHFDDQDISASGVVGFKIEDQDLLDSVLIRLAKEASLKQRGDAYYRSKEEGTFQDN